MLTRPPFVVLLLIGLTACGGTFDGSSTETGDTDTDSDNETDWIDTACDFCVEDCGDGEDNDKDNLVDCLDPDCEGDEACVEICDDGEDNDNDGRVDCEDGDCAGFPGCSEVCDDGEDNDGDGLVDCLDDDCWGPDCHTTGVTSWVDGGRVVLNGKRRQVERYTSICEPMFFGQELETKGVAYAVTGKVQVNLRGATGPTECDWRVDRVDFGNQTSIQSYPYFRSSSKTSPVTRTGVSVTPGCAIEESATWFLPTELRATWGGIRDENSVNWYVGRQINYSQSSTWGYNFSCSSYWYSYMTRKTYDPLNRAGSVTKPYP